MCPDFSLQSLPMPDRFNRWKPAAVSGDGRWVGGLVEGGQNAAYAAVLWSKEIGARVPAAFTQIVSLSADGRRQLLSARVQSASGDFTVMLEGDRFVPLEGDFSLLSPTDMNDTASTIAGYFTVQSEGRQRTFRWHDGQTQIMPDVPLASCPTNNCWNGATAISGDGTAVVGQFGERAFRWRGDTVELLAIDISGVVSFTYSNAVDVSRDGRFILGWGTDAAGSAGSALRWDERGGLERIPPPDTRVSLAWITPTAISGDGQVVVGNVRPGPRGRPRPWIWDEVRGSRELESVLVDAPDLENWRLLSADAISADGQYIVGTAAHRGRAVGYIARVARQ